MALTPFDMEIFHLCKISPYRTLWIYFTERLLNGREVHGYITSSLSKLNGALC